MQCKEIIGNVITYNYRAKEIDLLHLEWFEMSKRIMRKRSEKGKEIAIKFLKEGQYLNEGDIVFEDEKSIVVIAVLPCESLEVTPRNLLEMGKLCYEIGNKHLPLFIQDDKVLVAYEKPLERLLIATGYQVERKYCKLVNMLKANINHSHAGDNPSLFSKILDLTSKQ